MAQVTIDAVGVTISIEDEDETAKALVKIAHEEFLKVIDKAVELRDDLDDEEEGEDG